jgi:hypothetical protein
MGSESRAGTSLYSRESSPCTETTHNGGALGGRSAGWRSPPLPRGPTPTDSASPALSWAVGGAAGGGGRSRAWHSASTSPVPESSGRGGAAVAELDGLPAVAAAMMAAAAAGVSSVGPSPRDGAGGGSSATLLERRARGLATRAHPKDGAWCGRRDGDDKALVADNQHGAATRAI